MSVLPPDPSGNRLWRDATLEEFELSVPEKRDAGVLLLNNPAQRFTASGIYLLGYVAEQHLKCAYFRFKEGPSIQADSYGISRVNLNAARAEAKRLALHLGVPEPDYGSYHSIQFWAFLLRETRVNQGHAWADSNFDQEFRSCTDRLHNNWNVAMRYFPDSSLTLDSTTVRDDALWLDMNYKTLWEV